MKDKIYNYIKENKGVSLVDIFDGLNLQNKKGNWLVYITELEKENKIRLDPNVGFVIKH